MNREIFNELKKFCNAKGLQEKDAAYLLGLFNKHNKNLDMRSEKIFYNTCTNYEQDNTTSMNCKHCGKSKWMHIGY